MTAPLKAKAEALPQKPGIYFFKNGKGEIIYIGKARDLRDRVRSYFQPTEDPKVRNILAETAEIDVILTDSEREAAFLENNFVQQYQPRFNLRLKDDKSFPYLKMNIQDPFPGVRFSRKVEQDGARYFGPFSPAGEVRRTIHLLNKYFQIRNCAEEIPGKRKRPCLDYELGLCAAPCVGFIAAKDYRRRVNDALLFLEGKTGRLTKILGTRMARAAESEDFEEAARLRDIIRTLETIKVKPKLISVRLENQDIFGHAREAQSHAVDVFLMREGKVRESKGFVVDDKAGRSDGAILEEVMSAYYRNHEIPERILVPFDMPGKKNLAASLSAIAGRKIEIGIPSRGKNRNLIDLAAKNAEILLHKKNADRAPLEEIRRELGLEILPVRIDGFDVSNTGGTETVASLVTFVNGRPDKDGYRKYRIRTVEGPNDVASLGEVMRRRYARALEEKQPLPDLILVDGGKPQIGTARKVLSELGLERLPLISLAKKEEIVFTPSHKGGLKLDRTSPALKLFQHVRDEAHRFALRYHRQRRSRRSFD
jgi:excinuclease ABC subunit C